MSWNVVIGIWIAAGFCLVMLGTFALVVIGLALDQRKTWEDRGGCRSKCRKRLQRMTDAEIENAFVRGGLTLKEVRDHYEGRSR